MNFEDEKDYERLTLGAKILAKPMVLENNNRFAVEVEGLGKIYFKHDLSKQEFQLVRAGGLLNFVKKEFLSKILLMSFIAILSIIAHNL